MCLDSQTKLNQAKQAVGYKVFYTNDSIGLNKPYWAPMYMKGVIHKLGETVVDNWGKYKPGFHIFRTKAGAEAYCNANKRVIVEVSYKKIVASGYQWIRISPRANQSKSKRYRVDVAKEMTLVKEVT